MKETEHFKLSQSGESVDVHDFFRDKDPKKFADIAYRIGGSVSLDDDTYIIEEPTGAKIEIAYYTSPNGRDTSHAVFLGTGVLSRHSMQTGELLMQQDSVTIVNTPSPLEGDGRIISGTIFSKTEGVSNFRKREGVHEIPQEIVNAADKAAIREKESRETNRGKRL